MGNNPPDSYKPECCRGEAEIAADDNSRKMWRDGGEDVGNSLDVQSGSRDNIVRRRNKPCINPGN